MSNDFVPKEGTGFLFINDKRESDNHPNVKGTAMFEGVLIDVAAWTRVGKNGNKFQSLKLSRPRQKEERQEPRRESSRSRDDDQVPF